MGGERNEQVSWDDLPVWWRAGAILTGVCAVLGAIALVAGRFVWATFVGLGLLTFGLNIYRMEKQGELEQRRRAERAVKPVTRPGGDGA